MPDLPTVTLDVTLAELYKSAGPKFRDKAIGQVLCGTNSSIKLSDDFPRNVKFLYQDTPFNTLPKDKLTEENTELQRSLAMKYLSLVPQREAFIAGDATVFLFNVDLSADQMNHDRQEVEKTTGILESSQRPRIVFCPSPDEIDLEKYKLDLLACKLVLDGLTKFPMTYDLERHWFLNSKEALARSGLPTPDCEIIELEGYSKDSQSCCIICKSGEALFISPDCVDERGQWLNKATDLITVAIEKRPLPFVVKNQQTFGGAGTWVVSEETERKKLLSQFSENVLRKLFSQVTKDNYHLKPGTILLSDMVSDPVGNSGLTFFVREDGSAMYLGVSEQMIDSNSAWIGSTITYSKQQQLEEKFGPIMAQISTWLHEYEYIGPCGADIMETHSADGSSNFNIIDLNVRTSGSMCLPMMRHHFSSRGFDCASSFSITVKSDRDNFIDKWSHEFESGQMCILSWYEDKRSGTSIADVAVGGEDETSLQGVMKKVQDMTDEVTF